jgi:hypothetical protein
VTLVRRTLPTALILCVVVALPAGADAAPGAEGGPLAPSLQELAKPSVRSLSRPAQARLLGIAATGPGSLIRAEGQILVDASFAGGAISRLPALRRAGGSVVASSHRYQEVTLSIALADLRQLAAVPGVVSVTPVRAPVVRSPGPCQGGSVISEGITQLNVEGAREKLMVGSEPSLEGEGLTVGVLSDSFNQATDAPFNASDDIINKDLPGVENGCPAQTDPVQTIHTYNFEEGLQPPTDEGRAMLQIVHDVVPKAKLAFTSAFNGELAFAEGIEELAAASPAGAEADVIVDDVSYSEEPFFQDGPVAVAIENVVDEGVSYLTAAGNDNLIDSGGNEFASWEAEAFRDSGDCPAVVRGLSGFNAHHCLDFNPAALVDPTFGLKVEPGRTLTVDLQWAEPWGGVSTDLDAFLLDAEGRLLTVRAEPNVETKTPVEVLQWTNESSAERTVQFVVNRFAGGNPRLKFILLENGRGVSGTEYPRSGGGDVVGPTVYGHAGTAAAIAAGAVSAVSAVSVEDASEPEAYSSRGPVTHYFGPVEPSGAAPPLGLPEVVSTPNVTATDCGRTTFFSIQKPPNIWRFCGSSAAAPHAAGVATLAIEANGGSATPTEVREALTRSGTTGGFPSCAVGGGLLEAVLAVEVIRGEKSGNALAACTAPDASGPVVVAAGNWGTETPPTPPVQPETPVTPPPTESPTPPQPTPAKPPSTSFRVHPPKVVRTTRARVRVVFQFAANRAGSTFRCQIDGSAYRGCQARLVCWFGLGPHVVRVKARAGGLLDPTPAVFHFKVVRSR